MWRYSLTHCSWEQGRSLVTEGAGHAALSVANSGLWVLGGGQGGNVGGSQAYQDGKYWFHGRVQDRDMPLGKGSFEGA